MPDKAKAPPSSPAPVDLTRLSVFTQRLFWILLGAIGFSTLTWLVTLLTTPSTLTRHDFDAPVLLPGYPAVILLIQ